MTNTQPDGIKENDDLLTVPKKVSLEPTKMRGVSTAKDAPEICYPLLRPESVIVHSSIKGATVPATVAFADPDSGKCLVEFTMQGTRYQEWVRASEVVPPLILEKLGEPRVASAASDIQGDVRGRTKVVVPRIQTL